MFLPLLMKKGHQAKGKGEANGKGRNRMLDAPQKSWCLMLKGPFAPEAERYQCEHTCTYCEAAGVQLYCTGSWEYDVQWDALRLRFQRGEVDKWNLLVQGGGAGGGWAGLQGLQQPPLLPGPGPPVPPGGKGK